MTTSDHVTTAPRPTTRIALVGDRSAHVRAHGAIPRILAASADVEAYWMATNEVSENIGAFDGIWVTPGSPYADEDGALRAVSTARVEGIPFLGTCGGFQHALLEFARNVAGLSRATHAENEPDATKSIIVPLACSLVGHEGEIVIAPDTIAARIAGPVRRRERFHCSYGLVPGAEVPLERAGLVVSGRARDGERDPGLEGDRDPGLDGGGSADGDGDRGGEVRIVELPGHPFFLATLFQPELADDQPHPLIGAFVEAARTRAAERAGATEAVLT